MNLWGKSKVFQRYADQAVQYTRVIVNLAVQYDLKPSVARERFEAFRKANPMLDWITCGRHLQQTQEGANWMQPERVKAGEDG